MRRMPSSICPGTVSCARAALAMHGAAHVLLGDPEQGDLILALAADEAMRLDATDTRLLASERALTRGGSPR